MASRVYVIELERGAGRRRDPRIPWVYVGSSARTPEKRFEQHRRGYKSARLVKRFALRLRPDLYEDLDSFRGSKQACRAEKERARELAACGFVAHCDGTSYGKGEGGWEEWDAERLEPVSEHVDAAVADLAESCFEPPLPADCARLLHGELGFWVQRYLDQLDPPPAYGRFAHVRLDVLTERVARLAESAEPAPAQLGPGAATCPSGAA
jgi:hypothetical protein